MKRNSSKSNTGDNFLKKKKPKSLPFHENSERPRNVNPIAIDSNIEMKSVPNEEPRSIPVNFTPLNYTMTPLFSFQPTLLKFHTSQSFGNVFQAPITLPRMGIVPTPGFNSYCKPFEIKPDSELIKPNVRQDSLKLTYWHPQ